MVENALAMGEIF